MLSFVVSLIAFADRFVPKHFRRDSEEFRRSRLVILYQCVTALYAPVFAITYWALGAPLLVIPIIGCVVLSVPAPFVLRRTGSFILAGNYLLALLAGTLLILVVGNRGVGDAAHYWTIGLPVFGSLMCGRRSGIAWVAFAILLSVALWALPIFGYEPGHVLGEHQNHTLHMMGLAALAVLMFMVAWIYETIKEDMRENLAFANDEMRLVLNNMGQGFITIAPDGTIERERSAIVDEWLGAPAKGAKIWAQLGSLDAQAGFTAEICWMQLGMGALPVDVALAQLPERMHHAGRDFQLVFRPIITDGRLVRVLLLISDISAEVARERAERAGAELVSVVRRLMSDRAGFVDFFDEAEDLCERIANPTPADDALVMRALHTLKGNCALFGVLDVATACHDLETAVSERGEPATLEERRSVTALWAHTAQALSPLLDRDGPKAIELSPAEHASFLEALASGASREELCAIAARWVDEPAGRRLSRLAEGARSLAVRLEKPALVVDVSDNAIRVPHQRWSALWANLVHVVRNAVDHGIEPAEHREAIGKPPAGRLRLCAKREPGEVVVEIADDGRGVPWERVAAKARAAGLPCTTTADLEEALFADGLSTAEVASDVSGRGVGLAAMRAACRQLGGRVRVRSEPDVGTTIEVRIPDVPTCRPCQSRT